MDKTARHSLRRVALSAGSCLAAPKGMTLRDANLTKLEQREFDVLVLGGGINGAVSAACLSAWGAKVALIDRSDFASVTSQQSSNLAWGGIKYMEGWEFGLVRKLCRSRNHLLRSYPSTVQEIRFYTVHEKTFRHGLWKLLLGTLAYWFLGGFFTKRPRLLTKGTIQQEEPCVRLDSCDGGVEYSDAYLHDNDARFVWNFIRSALDMGCVAANYVSAKAGQWHTAGTTGTKTSGGMWHVPVRDEITGKEWTIKAKVLVNACGPYVDDHNEKTGQQTKHKHVFSKGIHLLVPKVTESKRVLTFFADDGRLFFVIPMGPRTCIGTTDTRVERPETAVTPEDRQFVLENINKRLNLPKPLTEGDIIAERCGVRPLVVPKGDGGTTDWLQLSRKHVVELDAARNHVSIFGGKLTDCLNVGEEIAHAVKQLGVTLEHWGHRWHGEPPDEVRDLFFHQAERIGLDEMTPVSSSEKLSIRLWRRYGMEAIAMLESIRSDQQQAELLIDGAEYLRCELEHAARREMIVKLDDFLRRRSKIALVIARDAIQNAAGLKEACEILFGEQAEARISEYFAGK